MIHDYSDGHQLLFSYLRLAKSLKLFAKSFFGKQSRKNCATSAGLWIFGFAVSKGLNLDTQAQERLDFTDKAYPNVQEHKVSGH